MQLTADNPACIAHINAMQAVIQRMADNSRSCKLWCVTLVAAMLVLMANAGEVAYAWLALVPVLTVGILDTYYLSLEQRFRNSYNDFVGKLHKGELEPTEVYVIKPSGSVGTHVGKSLRSTAVWPFYMALVVLIVAAGWLA